MIQINRFLKNIFLLAGLLFVNFLFAQTNLALTAKVSTSHVSPWEILEAVNDDYLPNNSMDKGPGAYGNWEGAENYNTFNWVEYSFFSECMVDSVRVYWWTDGGGILPPTEAYVEVWGDNAFEKAGDIGLEMDQFNTLPVGKKTYKVRINMKSDAATGILELQVFGQSGTEPEIIPYIQVNNQSKVQTNQAYVNEGDKVVLSNVLKELEGGTYSWQGPKGFTSTSSEVVLSSVEPEQLGSYTFTYQTTNGFDFTQEYVIIKTIDSTKVYNWPNYSPTLNYNFRQEYPNLEMPTKDYKGCSSNYVAGSKSSGWWTFIWGKNRRSEVTDAAIDNMLEKFNTDFAYIRDTMGWPPDKMAKQGYRSSIYLYGSGLCTDNADTTALGGWQGTINGYGMVLASYYPVACYDPNYTASDKGYQTEAMIHEGIHSILSDMPGCKDACWFQEGGNTWLQQEMSARRTGNYSSMGSLNGCTFIAPFMPIECYSGWLQDGSFGGPCAQGVNMFEGSQQICTWRTYLGGNQYGNTFPVFLGEVLGTGSIPWIWRYCEGKVLEGMSDSLGDVQTRRLITEYRAKQATVDFGKWTGAIRKLLDANFNLNVGAEWQPSWLNPDVWVASPYARSTMDNSGTITPEARTTPGWSGANQLPLKVKSDSVYVNFQPKSEGMTCQIAYRDIFGNCMYSEPVSSGNCTMKLQSPPANDVVIVVVSNTDYVYKGEETRKAHFDYRLKIDTTLTIPAHTHKRWYAWDDHPDDDVTPDLPDLAAADSLAPSDLIFTQSKFKENNYVGKKVGVFTTEDANSKNHTYELVSGEGDTDNSRFRISVDELQAKEIFDYEFSPTYSIRVKTTNGLNKSLEKSFTVNIENIWETGVDDLSQNDQIEFYPNPMTREAIVKTKNGDLIQSIKVFDVAGSTIKEAKEINADNYVLSGEKLDSGIYFLRVKAEKSYYIKFLVNK